MKNRGETVMENRRLLAARGGRRAARRSVPVTGWSRSSVGPERGR